MRKRRRVLARLLASELDDEFLAVAARQRQPEPDYTPMLDENGNEIG